MTHYCTIDNITKDYISVSSNLIRALENVSFFIDEHEFLAIVGPSGSGKSTLLNIIAGIERPTSGTVSFPTGSNEIKVGFVFQTDSVFPWRTVEKNLTYALELQRASKEAKKRKALEICQLIGLDPGIVLNKYPKELSGGERRRVALGMALAYDAEFLLLDEPTTQLDYVNKWSIQNTIQRLWMLNKFTSIVVTHDLEEAIFLGDRVLILEGGKVKAELNIELPRPRHDSLRSTERFNSYRKQISQYHGISEDECQAVKKT